MLTAALLLCRLWYLNLSGTVVINLSVWRWSYADADRSPPQGRQKHVAIHRAAPPAEPNRPTVVSAGRQGDGSRAALSLKNLRNLRLPPQSKPLPGHVAATASGPGARKAVRGKHCKKIPVIHP